MAEAARAHGGSEKGLHRVVDRAFRDDESGVRVGQEGEHLVLLRQRVVTLVKRAQGTKGGDQGEAIDGGRG
ncbi:MAG: hypothetical protein ACYDAR_19985 [Thermomicrobiales bacterium]